MGQTRQSIEVSLGSRYRGSMVGPALLWGCLYAGLATVLYAIFTIDWVETPDDPFITAAGLAAVVTGLALLAVLADRAVFTRQPEDLLTRQSPWVLVLVGLTVLTTTGLVLTGAAPATDAVLFGLAIALPLTMLLFAAVNIARYRTMEHRR